MLSLYVKPHIHLLSVRKRFYYGIKCLYDLSKPESWKHSATAHAFSLQSELKALHRKREKTEILHSIIGTLSSRLTHPWHVSSLLSIWINIVCWQCHAWLLYSYYTKRLYSTRAFWWWEHEGESKKCEERRFHLSSALYPLFHFLHAHTHIQ